MSDLILHHYPTSPFAEKIRRVLAYKKLAWKSVIIPRVMPKPDVVALTGGYRRTPLLQIGADIYCDTALICDVLEHLQPAPSLHPEGTTGAVRIVAQWADSTLFWASMAYSFSPAGAAFMFKDQTPDEAKAFAEDRAKMRAGGGRMPAADATSAYKSYLRRIASMVDHQPFVMGQQPCLADFSCYHALWFTRRIAPLGDCDFLVRTQRRKNVLRVEKPLAPSCELQVLRHELVEPPRDGRGRRAVLADVEEPGAPLRHPHLGGEVPRRVELASQPRVLRDVLLAQGRQLVRQAVTVSVGAAVGRAQLRAQHRVLLRDVPNAHQWGSSALHLGHAHFVTQGPPGLQILIPS